MFIILSSHSLYLVIHYSNFLYKRILLFDILHVDIAGPIHLGNYLGSLFDDIRGWEKREVLNDDILIRHRHLNGLCGITDETTSDLVGAKREVLNGVIAIQVAHDAFVRVLNDHVCADEDVSILSVRQFPSDGALRIHGADRQNEEGRESESHAPWFDG